MTSQIAAASAAPLAARAPLERATALIDTLPPISAAGAGWSSGREQTRDVPLHGAAEGPAPAGHRGWVVTAATACFAILVGIIVGMLVLKLIAPPEAPSLALENTQRLQELLEEGERLADRGRCDEAARRAGAVLLLAPDNRRARVLQRRCQLRQ